MKDPEAVPPCMDKRAGEQIPAEACAGQTSSMEQASPLPAHDVSCAAEPQQREVPKSWK